MQIGRVQGNLFNYSKMNELKNNGVSNNLNRSSANYCDLPICSPDRMLISFGKSKTLEPAIKINNNKVKKMHKELLSIYRDAEKNNGEKDLAIRKYVSSHRKKHLSRELQDTLSKKTNEGRSLFCELMGVITPDTFDVILRVYNGDIVSLDGILTSTNKDGTSQFIFLQRNKDERKSGEIANKIIKAYEGHDRKLKEMLMKKDSEGLSNLDRILPVAAHEARTKLENLGLIS